MTQQTSNVLEVSNLTKIFETGSSLHPKKIHAVNHVSFALKEGSITALIGESGSGKSTVARLISRLITPTSGVVKADGQVMQCKRQTRRKLLKFRKSVQMVFQDPFGSLNSHYKIENILMGPLKNYKIASNTQQQKAMVVDVLEAVGLSPAEDFLTKYPHELSGGQRQRIVIARALILEPKILLADEPTSMLDVSIRVSILNLLKRLRDERGLSLLFISHDLASARYLADEILVMYAGNLIEGGSTDEIIENPLHPYTQLLLSAVPDVGDARAKNFMQLKGEATDRSSTLSGCPFYGRCPVAMDKCKDQMPERFDAGRTHWASCHLY